MRYRNFLRVEPLERKTTSMERRFTPLTQSRRSFKVQGPSRLASLSGSRAPGHEVRMTHLTKPPKRRFKIGQLFVYDGSVWQLIYMFRVKDEPGVWLHCLEEVKKEGSGLAMVLADGFTSLGAGSTTPRVVHQPFVDSHEAMNFFSDIYRRGSSTFLKTQELIALKCLNPDLVERLEPGMLE